MRSAVPLDDAQQQRLAAALSQATGKQVEVKVVVDEKVLGGLVATIGDTVIDGTVRHRLAQLKERSDMERNGAPHAMARSATTVDMPS